MDLFIRYLNDARIRSAAAGGVGGFLGWFAAELFVGRPSGLGAACAGRPFVRRRHRRSAGRG